MQYAKYSYLISSSFERYNSLPVSVVDAVLQVYVVHTHFSCLPSLAALKKKGLAHKTTQYDRNLQA